MFRKRQHNTSNKIFGTSFLAISLLAIIVLSLSIFYSKYVKHEKVLSNYCGDFGLYGKNLTLYEDNTFIYQYHGCSQIGGYISGNWETKGIHLKLSPNVQDKTLNEIYVIKNNNLASIENDSIEFTLCTIYYETRIK